MTSQRRKSGAAIGGAAVLIGLTAVAFTLDGSPTPRPWYLFAGVAAAFTLLAVGVAVWDDGSALTLGAGAYVTLLGGFFLRASPFVRVVSSGYDYGRWLGYAERFVETGALRIESDMYSASPLYILDVVVGNWIVGGPMYSARFFTVAIASALPLFVGVLAYRVTNRPLVGYLAVVLGTAAPLFFRTSVLLESESLALCWFVLGTYLFVRCFEIADRRYQALFLVVAGTAVIVHFFYGVVLLATVAGTLAVWHVLAGSEGVRLPRAVHSFRLDLSVGAVSVVTTGWILWSTYAHTAVLTFQSGTTIRGLSNPLALFIPSSGSTGASIGAVASDTAASTGAAGGPSAASLTVQLYPVLLVLALACAGAAYAYRELPRSHVGLIVVGVVGVLSVVATVVGLDYDLGFRMYYFAIIFALPFAAVGLGVALRADHAKIGGRQPVVVAAAVVLVFSYALIAPVTPIGNNVDPKLGGNSWKMTTTERDQLTQLGVRFDDDVYVDNRLPQTHEYFLPGGPPPEEDIDRPLYITSSDCGNASRISDTSSYSVCLPSS